MSVTIHESARDVPVVRKADVLVCGGGPAGIAAAFTAARCGAKVTLLERHPFLGGVWTAGALTILIDSENKGGFALELRERLANNGQGICYSHWPKWPIYAIEGMKFLLDDMVQETGIDVQLYTSVASAERDGDTLKGVYTESKSGREFIEAKIIIDATGDGDVAARAGCPFEFGRPKDGKTQPMTLYGRVGGYTGGAAHMGKLTEVVYAAGLKPSYERITIFPQPGQPGICMLMATHLWGDATNVRDLTKAEFDARKEIREIFAVLKRDAGEEWRNAYLIDTGPFVGVRETRRILGKYYLAHEDLQIGRRFDDGICHVTFAPDIHHCDPNEGRGLFHEPYKPYDIPYRCLLARDVSNLMLAGRCISGDHVALASYRVTGDAVAMGEAAGVAAAMAIKAGVHPDAIDSAELVRKLGIIRTKSWREKPWGDLE